MLHGRYWILWKLYETSEPQHDIFNKSVKNDEPAFGTDIICHELHEPKYSADGYRPASCGCCGRAEILTLDALAFAGKSRQAGMLSGGDDTRLG